MEHINKKTEKYKIYSVVYIREDGQEFVDYIAADKIGNAFKLIKMFKVNVNFSSFKELSREEAENNAPNFSEFVKRGEKLSIDGTWFLGSRKLERKIDSIVGN